MIQTGNERHWSKGTRALVANSNVSTFENMQIMDLIQESDWSARGKHLCPRRNLITTIANELKAFTKYNHAGTMKSHGMRSNIRPLCSA